MSEETTTLEVLTETDDTVRGKVIVSLQGRDFSKDLDYFGLSIDSTEREVMDAISPVILEEYGVDIADTYKIQKALNNENIHLLPNSIAGD